MERAANPPPGWPGWPEGRQFAVVLTHDVEGQIGVDRCLQLADLEQELGFRSSFNFVPEGDYRTPPELRRTLVTRGFEVGVHDLHHDGRLLQSREAFRQNARRINHYLKDWQATGFRAGFMLHNLDWFSDLEIGYDASTFDTDPFEPQPDGVGTIFPFLVRHPSGRTYAELPYTLVQDFTLFTILQEPSIDLWKKKLDWIARHGGMALLNLHPDYVCFNGHPAFGEFPAAAYREFLEYVRDKYSGRYWQPLPQAVSDFCHQAGVARSPRSGKRICMVSYSHYERDNRVMRYARALAARGDHVDVLALRAEETQPARETLDGVHVHRIQHRVRNERGKFSYLYRLVLFFLRSSWRVAREHARRPYDLLHVHNVPDFLAFTALYPRLTGARVILDIHDMLPEFFGEKFGGSTANPYVRLLQLVERWSARVANHVIVSNHLWLETYTARSAPPAKCSAFINYVDATLFQQPRTRDDGRFLLLYHGGLQPHQGLDIAIRAFTRIRDRLPDAEFHIYGDGSEKPALEELIRELGLEGRVRLFPSQPAREIAFVVANADLGIVAKRADSFGNEAFSTKILEFMAAGVPVVASRTRIDTFYYNDSLVRFFESGNPDALAAAVIELRDNPPLRASLIRNGIDYVRANSWSVKQRDYLELVDHLAG